MERISRNNYESYLIDWMEGNLDARKAEELMAFLDANADIREELEEFENIHLEPEEVTYEAKDKLKQRIIIPVGSVSENNYEVKFIAFYENDLSSSESKEVEQFVALNPSLKQEFETFGKLVMVQNESIVFNDKESLYQKQKLVPLFLVSSVAAVLIVLFSIIGLVKYDVFNIPESNKGQIVHDIPVQIKTLPAEPEKPEKEVKNQPEKEQNIAVAEVSENRITKTKPVKKVYMPVQQSKARVYKDLAMMPVTEKPIKLTCDEVYCRFKYKDALASQNEITVEKRKSLFGKLLANVFNNAKGRLIPAAAGEKNNEPLVAKIFDGGACILNNFTGTEANVTKYYDNRGNLVAYQFSGGQLQFSRQFKPAAE